MISDFNELYFVTKDSIQICHWNMEDRMFLDGLLGTTTLRKKVSLDLLLPVTHNQYANLSKSIRSFKS